MTTAEKIRALTERLRAARQNGYRDITTGELSALDSEAGQAMADGIRELKEKK